MYVVDHGMPDVIHAHSAVFAGDVARQLAEELRGPICTYGTFNEIFGWTVDTSAEVVYD